MTKKEILEIFEKDEYLGGNRLRKIEYWLEEITLPAQQSWPSEEEEDSAFYKISAETYEDTDGGFKDGFETGWIKAIKWLKSRPQKGGLK